MEPSPRTWVGFMPSLEAVWWAETGGTANSQSLINAHSSLQIAEGRTRGRNILPRLSAFTHLWPGGTAEMLAGSRARAEDLRGFLTLSEGPKGAQCAFHEGLPGEGTTVDDR